MKYALGDKVHISRYWKRNILTWPGNEKGDSLEDYLKNDDEAAGGVHFDKYK